MPDTKKSDDTKPVDSLEDRLAEELINGKKPSPEEPLALPIPTRTDCIVAYAHGLLYSLILPASAAERDLEMGRGLNRDLETLGAKRDATTARLPDLDQQAEFLRYWLKNFTEPILDYRISFIRGVRHGTNLGRVGATLGLAYSTLNKGTPSGDYLLPAAIIWGILIVGNEAYHGFKSINNIPC